MTARRVTLAAVLCTFIVHLIRYEGPVTGYWDTYIAAPALHLHGQAAGFYLSDGSPAYPHTRLSGKLPDDLVDRRPGGFGVISEDQRLGAAVIAAPFHLAFGLFGFRLLHASAWAAASGFIAATAMALRVPAWAALLSALAMALNPYALSVNRLNANVVALPALAAILWLLFAFAPRAFAQSGEARARAAGIAAIAGLLLGVIGGVRNECVLLLPAIVLAMAMQAPPQVRWRMLAVLFATALPTLAPSLFWQQWAFGRMLIHASQFEGFEGFRPTFPHALGPLAFEFNGLLNWPFHDQLIRTPHFPYPTYVLLPLVMLRSFGVALAAATLAGAAVLWRRRPALALCAALWVAALWGMLSVQENWEELKMTYLVLIFPPAALLFAGGLQWLADKQSGATRLARLAGVGAVAAALWLGGWWLGSVQVPADTRWWQRFPHAAVNRAGYAELPHRLRWSWEFFHSQESETELRRERERLQPPALWPRIYRSDDIAVAAAFNQMAAELGTHELRTLAIWKYIYAPP